MLELLRKIHLEQAAIDQELSQTNAKNEFYRNFFKKYSYSNIEDILKIDICDLAIAFLGSVDDSLPMEELIDAVYSNRELIENLNNEGFDEILNMVINLDSLDLLEIVTEKLARGDRVTRVREIFNKANAFTEAVANIAEDKGSDPKSFAKFLKIIDREARALSDLPEEKREERGSLLPHFIMYKESLKELREEHLEHKQIISEMEETYGKLNKRTRARALVGLDRCNGWDLSVIKGQIEKVRRYAEKINEQEVSREKSLKKSKMAYDNLEDSLYRALNQQGVEIRIPEKIVSRVPSADIRKHALKLIYQHNMAIYEQKEQEYNELSQNDSSHYQVLLAKYGISPNEYEVGTIMNNTLTDIEEILSIISSHNIKDTNIVLTILKTSDLETVKAYSSLIEKGIITRELVYTHLNLFNSNSKEYENMMRNQQILQERKINPRYFTTTDSVLLTPHQRFKNNLDVLENYQLTSLLQTGINTSFMANNSLSQSIDLLLELGYEQNLEESIELLNYSDKFNRLKLLKTLNIPVSTTEELFEVLTTQKFFVPDEQIDSYIYNAVEYNLPGRVTKLRDAKKKNPELNKIEKYQETPRTYSFDGVIISKPKVARNISYLAPTGKQQERILHAVIQGSTLTDEEVSKVISCIQETKTINPVKQK